MGISKQNENGKLFNRNGNRRFSTKLEMEIFFGFLVRRGIFFRLTQSEGFPESVHLIPELGIWRMQAVNGKLMKRGQTAWRAFLRTGHTISSPGPSELLTRRAQRTRLPDTRCNVACNIGGLATKLCKQAKSFLLRHSIAHNG